MAQRVKGNERRTTTQMSPKYHPHHMQLESVWLTLSIKNTQNIQIIVNMHDITKCSKLRGYFEYKIYSEITRNLDCRIWSEIRKYGVQKGNPWSSECKMCSEITVIHCTKYLHSQQQWVAIRSMPPSESLLIWMCTESFTYSGTSSMSRRTTGQRQKRIDWTDRGNVESRYNRCHSALKNG